MRDACKSRHLSGQPHHTAVDSGSRRRGSTPKPEPSTLDGARLLVSERAASVATAVRCVGKMAVVLSKGRVYRPRLLAPGAIDLILPQ